MVRAIQQILSENPKVQCLVFSQWTSTLRKLEDALRAQNLESIMPGSTKRRRGRTAVKPIVLLTTDFLCSEKLGRQDRQEHAALDEHAVTRHVFLANTFYTAAAFTADVLEQRIIDFAKTSQLGVASAAILHRFVMNDTVPRLPWNSWNNGCLRSKEGIHQTDLRHPLIMRLYKPWGFGMVSQCFPIIFRQLLGLQQTMHVLSIRQYLASFNTSGETCT